MLHADVISIDIIILLNIKIQISTIDVVFYIVTE